VRLEDTYMKRIRNPRKRSYAMAYLAWQRGEQPRPNRDDYGLSYMGAQAVELELGGKK
jgi:hypothetical protein